MFQNREAELIYEVTYDSAIRIAHLEQKSSWTYTALNIPLQKQSHLNEEKYVLLFMLKPLVRKNLVQLLIYLKNEGLVQLVLEYTKNHWIVQFKLVNCMYVNKVFKKMKDRCYYCRHH